MYTGGLLAMLLILGVVLLVSLLAVLISEPRGAEPPGARENPGDITRRLRAQKVTDRRSRSTGKDTNLSGRSMGTHA